MFERKFFLGFQIDELYQNALSSVNKQLFEHFVQSKGNYLQQVTFQGQDYLGCHLKSPIEISDLELMQVHTFSLLRRLVPETQYLYNHSILWLFPVVEFSNQKD